ncbi:hypothetical protein HPB51_020006 [Rhipicephalus microplus]|uniref:Tick transposon n=1 Tax=Rhipicephalus microplus TaxID=6941 RepID=A0A9J6E2V3_RHIMP|nr:hypothetical protein HPB51_020006 [Rhipicephalus microplus]
MMQRLANAQITKSIDVLSLYDEGPCDNVTEETVNTHDVWSSLVDGKLITTANTLQKFVDAGESELPVCDEASSDDAIFATVQISVEVSTDDESVSEDDVDLTPELDFPCNDTLEYITKVK